MAILPTSGRTRNVDFEDRTRALLASELRAKNVPYHGKFLHLPPKAGRSVTRMIRPSIGIECKQGHPLGISWPDIWHHGQAWSDVARHHGQTTLVWGRKKTAEQRASKSNGAFLNPSFAEIVSSRAAGWGEKNKTAFLAKCIKQKKVTFFFFFPGMGMGRRVSASFVRGSW